MIFTAQNTKGPIAVRYPRKWLGVKLDKVEETYRKSRGIKKGRHALLAIGNSLLLDVADY